MKKLRFALLGVGLVLSACADQMQPLAPDPSDNAAFAAGGQVADPFMPGRVLARFRPGASAPAIAAANGARVEREVTLGILMLSVPAGAEARVVEALSRNPNVEFAELDLIRTFGNPSVMPVNDPFIGYKWDLDNDGKIYNSAGTVLANTGKAGADIDWKSAYLHLAGRTLGPVVIGIMDTGIRADHQDLVGRIAVQYNFFANTPNAADDDGHGTHVAGIAGAAANNGLGVAGVSFASETKFAIAKVCGPIISFPFSSYGCPLSAIAQGITWAAENGAHVINLSLGGTTGSQAEQQALQYARSKNVLPFCAAGNSKGAVSYPAAFPECVAVSATDWGDDLASYSNFGPQVQLSAPGGDSEDRKNGYSYILSSYYSAPDGYAFMAGTSMASPQAAGLAALLHATGITDPGAKLERMIATADDLGPAGHDNRFGHGRINVYRAVTGDTGGGGGGGEGGGGGGGGDDGGGDDGGDPSPPPTGFTLSAAGYKVKGVQHADLSWSGTSAISIDVFRGGTFLVTVSNSDAYTDPIGARGGGSYTYQVCEAGTTTCSDAVTVTF